MKEYTASIKLNESELKDVIAGYFGIKKDDVFFTIVEGGNYNESNYVNCEIHKKITVPENSEATLHYPPGVRGITPESACEHYCPNSKTKDHGDYGDAGPGIRANY